jgi:hypothetical protein
MKIDEQTEILLVPKLRVGTQLIAKLRFTN